MNERLIQQEPVPDRSTEQGGPGIFIEDTFLGALTLYRDAPDQVSMSLNGHTVLFRLNEDGTIQIDIEQNPYSTDTTPQANHPRIQAVRMHVERLLKPTSYGESPFPGPEEDFASVGLDREKLLRGALLQQARENRRAGIEEDE